jgi:hypothetical protein
MGFEWWFCNGTGDLWEVVFRTERSKSEFGRWGGPPADQSSGWGNRRFAVYRYNSIVGAEAHGGSIKLELPLRTGNSVDLPLFFAQDLCGCQSLDHLHRSTAARTLRQDGLMRRRCAYVGWRDGAQQSTAEREQLLSGRLANHP